MATSKKVQKMFKSQSMPLEARENALRLIALMLRGHLHLSEDDEEEGLGHQQAGAGALGDGRGEAVEDAVEARLGPQDLRIRGTTGALCRIADRMADGEQRSTGGDRLGRPPLQAAQLGQPLDVNADASPLHRAEHR